MFVTSGPLEVSEDSHKLSEVDRLSSF